MHWAGVCVCPGGCLSRGWCLTGRCLPRVWRLTREGSDRAGGGVFAKGVFTREGVCPVGCLPSACWDTRPPPSPVNIMTDAYVADGKKKELVVTYQGLR